MVNNIIIKREYDAIDIAKVICALLVVAIHTEPFASNYWLDKALGILTRIPVPYFFMASGFFLFLGGNEKISFEKLKKYCLRILLLYVVWSFFYLPFLFSSCAAGESFNTAQFFKSIFWLGTKNHFWYLIASVVAATMTWFFMRLLSLKTTLVCSFFLLIFGTLFSTYSPLIYKLLGENGGCLNRVFSVLDVIGTRNGIFYGFFYMVLGAYVAITHKTKTYNITFYAIIILISFISLAFESFFAVRFIGSKVHILWFSTPPLVWSLFIMTLQHTLVSPQKALICRNSSTIIYTSHPLFIALLIMFCAMKQGMLLFVATIILTTIFTSLILLLKNRIKIFKFLY